MLLARMYHMFSRRVTDIEPANATRKGTTEAMSMCSVKFLDKEKRKAPKAGSSVRQGHRTVQLLENIILQIKAIKKSHYKDTSNACCT